MTSSRLSYMLRHPELADLAAVYVAIVASETRSFGEPRDTPSKTSESDWKELELGQEAGCVIASDGALAGYRICCRIHGPCGWTWRSTSTLSIMAGNWDDARSSRPRHGQESTSSLAHQGRARRQQLDQCSKY